MGNRKAAHGCAAFFILLLSACATLPASDPGGGREQTEGWGAQRGFRPLPIAAAGVDLYAMLRQRGPAKVLPIYIEGDGAPWANPFRPPRDPTPHRSLALLLAAADDAPAVAYLARPCQYLSDELLARCPPGYWSERRFSPELLAALDEAVSRLKDAAGAAQVRLIGHSGGGVVAALLAARRDDVAELLTIAAPLALSAWVAEQGLTPLHGSLDPLLQELRLPAPPALHFAGATDEVVPSGIVARYVEARGGQLRVVESFGHDCCWQRDWKLRLEDALKRLRGSP